jgi:hypothetical protein
MKFLVVLAMALAVSSATLTGSLLHDSKPMVKATFAEMKADLVAHSRARNGADVRLQNEFLDAMEAHIAQVLAQIEAVLGSGIAVSENTIRELQQATQQLAQLTRDLQTGAISQDEFQAAYSEVFIRIIAILGVNNHADVEEVLALVEKLDLTEAVFASIRQVLGETLGNEFIAACTSNNRGFWDVIQGGINNIMNQLSQGLQAIGTKLIEVLDSIFNFREKFNALRELALGFAYSNWDNVAGLGEPAARGLLNSVAPYYCDLGKLAATLVSKILAYFTGLTIPPAIIVAVGGNIVSIITGNPVSCSKFMLQ